MNLPEIQANLVASHKEFTNVVESLSMNDFLFAPAEKWNAGQQMDHIYKSVSAVHLGLSLPKSLIGLKFGYANRPSKDFDSLVAKYKSTLAGGGKASDRYLPKTVRFEDREKMKEKLLKVVDKLCRKAGKYDEQELDRYILPHPLLGKLTVREMLYFTIYHVRHHQGLVLCYLRK